MIAEVLRLTLWEWRKLRRRWMPWVLLAVVVVVMQLAQWFTYAAYHNESLQEFTSGGTQSFSIAEEVNGESVSIEATCTSLVNEGLPREVEELPEERRTQFLSELAEWQANNCGSTPLRDDLRNAFTIPQSIAGAFTGLVGFGPILLIILAASHIGTEYGWGTLRPALTRGTGRWQLPGFEAVAPFVGVHSRGPIVVAVATALASLIAGVIPPDETGTLAEAGKWSEVSRHLGKGDLRICPVHRVECLLDRPCPVRGGGHCNRARLLRNRTHCCPNPECDFLGAENRRLPPGQQT